MTTRPLLSTDDLRGASEADLRAARHALRIKERVLNQAELMGRKASMTLAEYIKHCEGLVPQPCAHCSGTGTWTPPKPREIGCVHPSQAHRCVLRNYYDVTGELSAIEQVKWELQATFAIGHAIHGLVQTALRNDLGKGFVEEARVDMGLVRGNTDGDIWIHDEKGAEIVHAVLEIKTMGSEFDGLTKPKDDHILQAMGLYATGLDAPLVTYLYISKAWPYPIKEFVLDYDPKVYRIWMRNKGEKIQKALDSGDPPTADATVAECKECPYAHACPQKLEKKNGFATTRR